jgi:hypothetical protein
MVTAFFKNMYQLISSLFSSLTLPATQEIPQHPKHNLGFNFSVVMYQGCQ